MTEVAVRVPATTANLGPGFDTLGAALGRYLYAGIDGSAGTARVRTRGEGAGEVPDTDENLLWRSVVTFCERTRTTVPDVRVAVDNEIPLERGLGSSSAAIVAGLALARALTGQRVGDLDLVRMATSIEGHPDNVAPAVLGGFVACAPTDDADLVIRRAQPADAVVVVAVPSTRQNTNEARAALPASLQRPDVATQAGRAVHVAAGLLGTWPVEPTVAGDLLHEPARFEAMPASGALVRALRSDGIHAWLSGAGPSVAAIGHDRGAVDRAVALADGHGFDAAELSWDLAGVITCREGGCAFSASGSCLACPRGRL